jgi:MoaA/NifB/PqqE/SkfB family radical SAM enzyme
MMNRAGRPKRNKTVAPVRGAWNSLRANGESLLGVVPRPRALCLYVTYECNLRCRTCGIWAHPAGSGGDELSPAEMSSILADRLFARLEYVNLNGGEPLLRPDLAEISARILERFPRLKSLSLNSNGILQDRCIAQVREIASRCQDRLVPFSVSISLHAPGPAFDGIVGCPGAWDRVRSTLEQLQRLPQRRAFYLSVNCVVSALNAGLVEEMAAWGRAEGIPVNFVVAEVRERFHNQGMAEDFSLRADQRAEVVRFFHRLSLEEPFLRHHRLRYQVLADMLETGGPRRLSCHYRMGGAILGARGELFYCKFSREIGNCRLRPPMQIYFDPEQLRYRRDELLAGRCPHCLPNTFNRIELEKDLLRYLAFLLPSRLRRDPHHGRR